MKLFSSDAGEVVEIERLEQKGSVLMVHGRIFGAMPMTAELRPEEVREAFKLLDLKTILFLITLPFRGSTKAG